MKEILNETYANINMAGIRTKLQSLPSLIKVQKTLILDRKVDYTDALDAMNQEEAILVSLIASETNPQGKALYSNKEARDAELITRKKATPTYLDAKAKLDKASENLNLSQFELEKLTDELKTTIYLAKMAITELVTLGGVENEEVEVSGDVY
jgi:hypothetical protein